MYCHDAGYSIKVFPPTHHVLFCAMCRPKRDVFFLFLLCTSSVRFPFTPSVVGRRVFALPDGIVRGSVGGTCVNNYHFFK